MHKTGSISSGEMGSLRRDYVARIPIDLNYSPMSSKTIHPSTQYNLARLLVNSPNVVANGVSVVRCRIESDNSPNVIGPSDSDRLPDTHVATQQPQDMAMSGVDGSVRGLLTSSGSRENGSILKKPDINSSSQTLNSDRSKQQRTPQERRRVRFTSNVSLYRFDSDGVDSAYSSSECERMYAPISASVRKSASPNKYPTTTVSIPGNSQSNVKAYSVPDNTYDNPFNTYDNPLRSVEGRRFRDGEKPSLSPPGIRQEIRGPDIVHGTPNGSFYLRNDVYKTKSKPSVHRLDRTSPPTSLQKQGPVFVGSSSALKATSYTLVGDPVTQEKNLVITARLSGTYHPNDITIKVNRNGSKLRIVSRKSPFHHTSRNQMINEQILLPVQVDPHRLIARLDSNDSLLIEAPCVYN